MEKRVKENVLTKWDGLIHDAKRQIDDAKGRIDALRKTIRNLEQLRDSGQPWPKKPRTA
jgi:hypothetical protein